VPLNIIVFSQFPVACPSYWLLQSSNEYDDNTDCVATRFPNTDGNQRLVNTDLYDITCPHNNLSSFTAYLNNVSVSVSVHRFGGTLNGVAVYRGLITINKVKIEKHLYNSGQALIVQIS